MHKVKVTCSVKINGNVWNKSFETTVDNATIAKASGSKSKKELNPWAKTFFPAADSVELLSIQKI